MRRFSLIVFSLCVLLPLGAPHAFSEEQKPTALSRHTPDLIRGTADAPATPAKPAAGKTEIVTDEKAHAVRIFIDGKEMVTIDGEGMHLHGGFYPSQISGLPPPHTLDKAP